MTIAPALLEELKHHYGRKTRFDQGETQESHVERVRDVYEAINLRGVYAAYERRTVGELERRIAEVPVSSEAHGQGQGQGRALKPEVFTRFLDKIKYREK